MTARDRGVIGSPGQYLSRVTGSRSHLGDPVPMLVHSGHQAYWFYSAIMNADFTIFISLAFRLFLDVAKGNVYG